ncbi:MAG: choice-of-anchor J domain-containing protein, partial [Muribaculaceae bacterium]|nr:choice-of-anchor J domain-containing protein [Muribaculaceae bacterium]
SYTILPKSGNIEGKPVTSRSAYAGKYIGMPLNEKFEDPAMLLEYPIIDANNDGIYWDYGTKTYNGNNYGVAAFIGENKEADDYLLIGPFKMEKDAAYTFHMIAEATQLIETIEVKVGTNPTDTASFSTELIAPTKLDPNNIGQKCFDVSFEPETSGDYYFGIHICSHVARRVNILEVGVTALDGTYPAAPADFNAEPQATSAVLTFTLPDKCINGSELSELKEARVYRDNALLATITEGVAPGAAITFVDDTEVSTGYHNYTVTAANAESEGKYAACNVWRGPDYPARPTNLRIWEDLETPGLMHVTFDHAKRGFYGGYVNTDEIVYSINYLVMGVSTGDIVLGRGTNHTFRLPFNVTSQNVFAGSVYGSNSTGSIVNSSNWTTSTCYYGPAMTLPVHDSWSDGAKSGGTWSGQNTDADAVTGQSYWQTSSGGSQDADGGFFGITNTVDNVGKRALSPRVTLEGTEAPALVFYYRYTAQVKQFDLEIIVDDQPVRVLMPLDIAAENVNKWIRMEVPLTDFLSSKYIQFGFTATGLAGEDIARIDNLTISDLKPNDLGIVSFSTPVKVNVNAEASLTMIIRNCGNTAVAANDYTVKFYKNDELMAEMAGKALAADSETVFTAKDRPSAADSEGATYYAEIDYPADMNVANNTSSRSYVRVVIADYPTVSDLKGSYADGAITLTWSDPDMSLIPGVSTTETFESYASFTITNFGNWTLYDGDKANTVRVVNTMGQYDYPHNGEPMAWMVFNPADANLFNTAWEGRSGSQFLASFQAVSADGTNRQVKSDDWLISPELNGAEQVISFYSRAGLGAYAPELFDFMVSDKTTAIADFKPLAENVEVPYTTDSWTEFVFRVPAGTRYFAIVHKSFNMFAMLVDDITYIPAGSAQTQLDLNGFNVYRDGKRITSEPIGDNSFTDTDVEEGAEYTYSVSAIWDKGESHLSDSVTISAVSSLDNVTTYTLTITGHKGFIRISGGIGEQAEIFNMAGARVATVEAKDSVDVPVASAGVYVVRAGGSVAKVIVR